MTNLERYRELIDQEPITEYAWKVWWLKDNLKNSDKFHITNIV